MLKGKWALGAAGVLWMVFLAAGCEQAGRTEGAVREEKKTETGKAETAPAVTIPAGVIFYDGFEYEVKRDEVNAQPAFISQGKWSGVKSVSSGGRGANGYLYTADRIPGYTGAFPGRESKRVLAIEGRAGTLKNQTDFYPRRGDGPADQVPGNVWFQFWMYTNYYDDPQDKEDQQSAFPWGMKWIYPSATGNYPTHPAWLLCLETSSYVKLKIYVNRSEPESNRLICS